MKRRLCKMPEMAADEGYGDKRDELGQKSGLPLSGTLRSGCSGKGCYTYEIRSA